MQCMAQFNSEYPAALRDLEVKRHNMPGWQDNQIINHCLARMLALTKSSALPGCNMLCKRSLYLPHPQAWIIRAPAAAAREANFRWSNEHEFLDVLHSTKPLGSATARYLC